MCRDCRIATGSMTMIDNLKMDTGLWEKRVMDEPLPCQLSAGASMLRMTVRVVYTALN